MSRIDVRQDGKKTRVFINQIQQGIAYDSSRQANKEATDLHDKQYPTYELHLVEEGA